MKFAKQLKKSKKLIHNNLFLLLLIVLFLLVRLYNLEKVVNFSMDQGTTFLKLYEIWTTKKIPLIGPESSLKAINGLSFFHGPWVYYLLFPAALISHWNPLSASYLLISLNLLALIFLYKIVAKRFGLFTALNFGFIYCLDFINIRYSQFAWNPNFLVFTSSLILGFLLIINKKNYKKISFLLGLLFGFSLTFHYLSLLLFIPFCGFWVLNKSRKFNFKLLFLGFLIPLIPQIVFELRHNFYNLQIIYLILSGKGSNSISWPFSIHYFLIFLPFIYLIISLFIQHIYKNCHLLAYFLLIIITSGLLANIINQSQAAYTMPKGWNLPGIQKASRMIIAENKKDYNIVNLLSGDTRDYPLRYFLTIANFKPLDVAEYPQAKYLFILARKDQNITNNPVWEISSFCPYSIIWTKEIQNQIFLSLLKKSSL